MVLEMPAEHSARNGLEVRILHTAFADEWNGLPRLPPKQEITGSTPVSAIRTHLQRATNVSSFRGVSF